MRKQESEKIAAKEIKTPEAKPTKPELRAELLAMKDKDQEVVSCVLAEFEKLSFPEQDFGIVTVVYPIVFSPEATSP